MKNIFKATLAVAAIAAVGMGAYKTYSSYVATNMSDDDALLSENTDALAYSDGNNDGKSSNSEDELVWKKTNGICVASKSETKISGNWEYIRTVYYKSGSWWKCEQQPKKEENETNECNEGEEEKCSFPGLPSESDVPAPTAWKPFKLVKPLF